MAEETESDRQKEILRLYTDTFPLVARYIARMGGTLEEAKDIFHDAIVIYFEKQASMKGTLKFGEKAYLYGISKNLWHYRFRDAKQNIFIDAVPESEISAYYKQEPVLSKISKVLDSAGKKCMQLLSAFYYENLNMRELADKFGFAGERSATVQKYKCLEKVKDVVKQKSLTYEDFLE
jgi:DNA-directed RNA polymerase specialized sigma24 family protein